MGRYCDENQKGSLGYPHSEYKSFPQCARGKMVLSLIMICRKKNVHIGEEELEISSKQKNKKSLEEILKIVKKVQKKLKIILKNT